MATMKYKPASKQKANLQLSSASIGVFLISMLFCSSINTRKREALRRYEMLSLRCLSWNGPSRLRSRSTFPEDHLVDRIERADKWGTSESEERRKKKGRPCRASRRRLSKGRVGRPVSDTLKCRLIYR